MPLRSKAAFSPAAQAASEHFPEGKISPQGGFTPPKEDQKGLPQRPRRCGTKAAVSHRGKALAVFEEKLKEYFAARQ